MLVIGAYRILLPFYTLKPSLNSIKQNAYSFGVKFTRRAILSHSELRSTLMLALNFSDILGGILGSILDRKALIR